MRNAVLTLVSLSQWLDVVILMIIIIMKMLLWCWFLYGTFCHGALKHDISTLLTTSFLWTSLQFILDLNYSIGVTISWWQWFHLVRFDYKICGLITTCADVWGELLVPVTITKICIVSKRFQMKQRKKTWISDAK